MSDFLHPDRVSELLRTTPEMARKARLGAASVAIRLGDEAGLVPVLQALGLTPEPGEGLMVRRRWERR